MNRFTIALAALAMPVLANAQVPTPQLTLDQRMLLRCSAAFAMVAHGQQTGSAEALRYPDVSQRGREFFVRASAQVMEETGFGREQIAAALSAEAQDLRDNDTLGDVMPVCLGMLPPE